MSIITWLAVGLFAGFVGDRIVGRPGRGIVGSALVGALGAFAGGFTFNLLFEPRIIDSNLATGLFAALGSVALLIPYYALRTTQPRTRSPQAAPGPPRS